MVDAQAIIDDRISSISRNLELPDQLAEKTEACLTQKKEQEKKMLG